MATAYDAPEGVELVVLVVLAEVEGDGTVDEAGAGGGLGFGGCTFIFS